MLFEGNKARRFVRQKICALSSCLLAAHWCPEFCLITAVSNTAGVNYRTPYLPCLSLTTWVPLTHTVTAWPHTVFALPITHAFTHRGKVLLNGGPVWKKKESTWKADPFKEVPGACSTRGIFTRSLCLLWGTGTQQRHHGKSNMFIFPLSIYSFFPPFFISFPLSLALVKTLCYVWTTNLNCRRLEIE